MSGPTNVVIKIDENTRSFEQLIRKFIRKCKDEGVLKEYVDQFVYETKGQKNRRKSREARRRHEKNHQKK